MQHGNNNTMHYLYPPTVLKEVSAPFKEQRKVEIVVVVGGFSEHKQRRLLCGGNGERVCAVLFCCIWICRCCVCVCLCSIFLFCDGWLQQIDIASCGVMLCCWHDRTWHDMTWHDKLNADRACIWYDMLHVIAAYAYATPGATPHCYLSRWSYQLNTAMLC